MDPNYWLHRWQQQEIGFHQREFNPHLLRFWPQLRLASGARVFVPLAGKSSDVMWLRGQGHPVIGVELSPIAVSAFFAEAGLVAVGSEQGSFDRIEAPGVAMLIGDFFDLQQSELGPVAAVFDRGALVAFPPDMRRRYADRMAALVSTGAQCLLVAVEYDESVANGPPFSVREAEIRNLYEAHFDVTVLHEEDVSPVSAKFRNSGLRWLLERVYLLTRKA